MIRQTYKKPLVYSILASAALSFLIGISFSKSYWDYWLSPPSPSAFLDDVQDVSLVTRFNYWRDADNPKVSQSRLSHQFYVEEYEGSERFKHINWPAPRLRGIEKSELTSLKDTALAILPEHAPGYTNHRTQIWGATFRFSTASQPDLVFVAVRSGQLSNDHFRYEEFIVDASGNIIDQTGYFYDVAGIEGIYWYVISGLIFITLSLSLVCLFLGLSLIVRIVESREKVATVN